MPQSQCGKVERGTFARTTALEHSLLAVEQKFPFQLFRIETVAFVTTLSQHRPNLFLEQFEFLAPNRSAARHPDQQPKSGNESTLPVCAESLFGKSACVAHRLNIIPFGPGLT